MEKKVQWVTVDAVKEGQRLDNFLSNQLKGLPKGRIYKMIRTGEVRINKGRCKPDSRLSAGDIVRIPPVDLESPREQVAHRGIQMKLSDALILRRRGCLGFKQTIWLGSAWGFGFINRFD